MERKELFVHLMANQKEDDSEPTSETATLFREQLIHILANTLTDTNQAGETSISEWAETVAQTALTLNVPMEDALKSVKSYRTLIWDQIMDIVIEKSLPNKVLFEAIKRIDLLLDQAVYIFSLRYVKKYKDSLERAQTSFLEISAPIVPIFTGVAVLPLIGELSESRAKVIMEQTLKNAVKLQLEHLFIDLSGVITMDTMVSHEIMKIVNSLSLLGVQAILTGIRPEISRTIINLGIQFKTESRGTLKQAIEEFVAKQQLK